MSKKFGGGISSLKCDFKNRTSAGEPKGDFPVVFQPLDKKFGDYTAAELRDIAAERGVCGIQGKDFTLFVTTFQTEGFLRLNEFVPDIALSPAGQPYHLHGNGATAAYNVPAAYVVTQCTHNCNGVDARMPIEVTVLELYKGGGKAFRDEIAGRSRQ